MPHEKNNIVQFRPRTRQHMGEVAAEHSGVVIDLPTGGKRRSLYEGIEKELPQFDMDLDSTLKSMTPAEPMSQEEYAQRMSDDEHLSRQVQRGGTPFAE